MEITIVKARGEVITSPCLVDLNSNSLLKKRANKFPGLGKMLNVFKKDSAAYGKSPGLPKTK